MQKLFHSKNSDYIKLMSTLVQQEYKKKNVEIYLFNDFISQYKEIEDVALTISLFNKEKLVVIENCQFLTAGQSLSEEATRVFEQLIVNKPVNFILTVTNEKLDERKKMTKLVRQNIEVTALIDNPKTAAQLLKLYTKQENIKMNDQMLQQLLLQSNHNLFHSISEIKRFILQYKTNDFTKIQIPEIQKIPDEDIFFLGEFITKNNYHELLTQLKQWIQLHPNPADFQRVMRYLFNHAKLILEVENLARKRYSYTEIGKLLKIHEYRVKLLMPHMAQIQSEKLKQFINVVVEGDYMMKTGVMNRLLYMEMRLK